MIKAIKHTTISNYFRSHVNYHEISKKYILPFAIVAAIDVIGQDTIQWRPDYKLTWDDFQGKPDTTLEFGAMTFAGIRYSFKSSDTSLYTKVSCYFSKKISWVYVRS